VGRAQTPDNEKPAAELPPLLEQLKQRTDKLSFQNLISVSTIEAERFRQSLLTRASGHHTPAQSIASACVAFRKLNLAKDNGSPHDLSRFQLGEQEIVAAIRGERPVPDATTFYGSFEGKWYGIWDQTKVDHHWGPYQALRQPQRFDIQRAQPVQLLGYQYAWVGDGYGLNHLVSSADRTRTFLLGYVVHLRDRDPSDERVRRPHVGVVDGPDRLLWITQREVFFEELLRGQDSSADRYLITGFRYGWEGEDLVARQAFRAVYARSADQRQPWEGIQIELRVKTALHYQSSPSARLRP
jgi:hypothetical protein